MDNNSFMKAAKKLDRSDYQVVKERLCNGDVAALIHYSIGMCTELGELQDALKKYIAYGKELDKVNLIEESGDILWYLARTLDTLGSSFEEAMAANAAKLMKRYGTQFTEEAALQRDVSAERITLEGNIDVKEVKYYPRQDTRRTPL
jgi:NTP pyrophosphatase (non-canonical NTP hydrolase)